MYTCAGYLNTDLLRSMPKVKSVAKPSLGLKFCTAAAAEVLRKESEPVSFPTLACRPPKSCNATLLSPFHEMRDQTPTEIAGHWSGKAQAASTPDAALQGPLERDAERCARRSTRFGAGALVQHLSRLTRSESKTDSWERRPLESMGQCSMPTCRVLLKTPAHMSGGPPCSSSRFRSSWAHTVAQPRS